MTKIVLCNGLIQEVDEPCDFELEGAGYALFDSSGKFLCWCMSESVLETLIDFFSEA
jgi:hypothetical protein